MNEPQGLDLDPHPADPLARLQYLDKRLALCWRVMALAVSTAVASCAEVPPTGYTFTSHSTQEALEAYSGCMVLAGVMKPYHLPEEIAGACTDKLYALRMAAAAEYPSRPGPELDKAITALVVSAIAKALLADTPE